MRRVAVTVLVLFAATVLVVFATGASNGKPHYRVRAIFDNASFVIPGEDVKIAGVKVGKVDSLDVYNRKKAAVVIEITKPGFDDFRQDARCRIRPQSLIGEQFVECAPTQPHPPGQPLAPPLKRIPDGQPGAGQRLLPLQTRYGGGTTSMVGVDLVGDVWRLPYRQRLALIINELGTGLAANGQELRRVIRRADPALAQLDRVVAILARQNRDLANLQRDSDRVLAPLARDRQKVADFVVQAGNAAEATAERRTAFEQNFQKLPTFLRELQKTSPRLSQFADAATPVFADLGAHAPEINRVIERLGPFTKAALPAFRSLGETSKVSGPALQKSLPVTRDLHSLGVSLQPVASNGAKLLKSFKDAYGVDNLLNFIFYEVGALNGYDQYGHYLRSGLEATLLTSCNRWVSNLFNPQCNSHLNPNAGIASVAAARRPASAGTARGGSAPSGSGSTSPTVSPIAAAAVQRTEQQVQAGTEGSPSALLGYLMGGGR